MSDVSARSFACRFRACSFLSLLFFSVVKPGENLGYGIWDTGYGDNARLDASVVLLACYVALLVDGDAAVSLSISPVSLVRSERDRLGLGTWRLRAGLGLGDLGVGGP